MLSYLMKKIIIGATGAIGSSIAKKLVSNGSEVHLVARNQAEVETLASELNATFSVVDVLDQITTISSLAGVQEFPMRVKCATMVWHTFLSALNKKN